MINATHSDRAGLTVSSVTGPVALPPNQQTLVGSFDVRGDARTLLTFNNNVNGNALSGLVFAVAASQGGVAASILSNGDLNNPNNYVRWATNNLYQLAAGAVGACELVPAGAACRIDVYATSANGTTLSVEMSTGVTPIGS